jgi:hypothetical protein
MSQDRIAQIRATIQTEIGRQKEETARHAKMLGRADGIIIGWTVATLFWVLVIAFR